MFALFLVLAADVNEADLFGGDPQPASAPVTTVAPAGDAFAEGRMKEDFLKLGGLFYLRAYGGFSNERKLLDTPFSVPLLTNIYLDARPNDRIRAQLVGRLQYDPFFNGNPLGIVVPNTSPPANPSVALDQAWLAFDIAHTVFVTAGRQHVKWGTGRIFNPTDFLAASYRDPLAQFDARLGVTMLKVNIPWEAKGWNFYVVALFEPTQRSASSLGSGGSSGSNLATSIQLQPGTAGINFGDIGGAARIEFTIKNTQLSLDGLWQRNRKGRAGFDITTGIGPIDVFGEVAVKNGSDVPLFRLARGYSYDEITNPMATETYTVPWVVQAVGGVSYDIAAGDKTSVTLGGEYMFNSAGYENYKIYPVVFFSGGYQPFYTGKHYAAASVAIINTSSRTTTAFSTLGNLSDRSFISRVDFSIQIYNYLSLEAFTAVHYGQRGGEFRLSFWQEAVPGVLDQNIAIFVPLVDVGLGLRVSL